MSEQSIIVADEYRKRGSVAVVPESAPNNPLAMLSVAVAKGMDAATIKGFMDLQERWEKAEARKAYNVAFAAFKAEAVQAVKNRLVTDGPLKGKSYAELHSVVDAVTPALSKHGLSASWRVTKDDKDWIQITCTITHSLGHSESTSMGGPPDAGGAKSALQARASTVTYLERYTLKAICGISEKNDDSDGRPPQATGMSDEDVAGWIKKIEAKTTKDDAKAVWQDAHKAAQAANDLAAANRLKAALVAHGKFIDGAAKGAEQ